MGCNLLCSFFVRNTTCLINITSLASHGNWLACQDYEPWFINYLDNLSFRCVYSICLMFPFYSTFCQCLGVVLFSSVLVLVGLHGSIELFSVQWLYFGAMCWGFCCLYGGEDRALISIQYWLCDTFVAKNL